jgi:hypothetical protein
MLSTLNLDLEEIVLGGDFLEDFLFLFIALLGDLDFLEDLSGEL